MTSRHPEDRHPMLDQLSQLWRNKTAVAGLFVIINLSVDVLYAVINPRISVK